MKCRSPLLLELRRRCKWRAIVFPPSRTTCGTTQQFCSAWTLSCLCLVRDNGEKNTDVLHQCPTTSTNESEWRSFTGKLGNDAIETRCVLTTIRGENERLVTKEEKQTRAMSHNLHAADILMFLLRWEEELQKRLLNDLNNKVAVWSPQNYSIFPVARRSRWTPWNLLSVLNSKVAMSSQRQWSFQTLMIHSWYTIRCWRDVEIDLKAFEPGWDLKRESLSVATSTHRRDRWWWSKSLRRSMNVSQ